MHAFTQKCMVINTRDLLRIAIKIKHFFCLFLSFCPFFVCWVRLVDAGVSACALSFCAALLAAGLVCVSEEDETAAAAAATRGVWMSLVSSASCWVSL